MAGTKEALQPFPGINWAKNVYDPQTGDVISRILGVVRIGIGSTVYSLQEPQLGFPVITEREIIKRSM